VRIEKKGVRTQTFKFCYQGFGQSPSDVYLPATFQFFINTLSSMDIEVSRTLILVDLLCRAIATLNLRHDNSDRLVVPYNPSEQCARPSIMMRTSYSARGSKNPCTGMPLPVDFLPAHQSCGILKSLCTSQPGLGSIN
jgi:hypothetical protein